MSFTASSSPRLINLSSRGTSNNVWSLILRDVRQHQAHQHGLRFFSSTLLQRRALPQRQHPPEVGRTATTSPSIRLPLQSQKQRQPYASRYQSSYADPQFQNPTFTSDVAPKRSLPARIAILTLKYGLTSVVVFALGLYIGIKTIPSEAKELLLAASDPVPTSAETLTLYNPPDEKSAQINAKITSHPLAQTLRADARFVESRPHLKIPEAVRKRNLTGGTLAGPGGLAVPPLFFTEASGASAVSIFYLGEQLCGHPGLVHGGMLATLLDEGLARCCFPALPNKVAVTANLTVDYRKPVKAGHFYVLRATTQSVDGRKARVTGWIEPLSDHVQDHLPAEAQAKTDLAAADNKDKDTDKTKAGPVKLVEAHALYIEPRNAGVLSKLYGDVST